jgi:hypothetical protein
MVNRFDGFRKSNGNIVELPMRTGCNMTTPDDTPRSESGTQEEPSAAITRRV